MSDNILSVVDRCLARIKNGESIEQCLADYGQYRNELEPLLRTAVALSSIPRVTPSSEFKQASQSRLLARLKAESAKKNLNEKKKSCRINLRQILITRPLVPVSLIALMALIAYLVWPVFSPQSVFAAEYTLSVLSGKTEVQIQETGAWVSGSDGLKLKPGSRIRTGSNSQALLTFYDGSTTKLEADTEVRVIQSEHDPQNLVSIALEQQSGRT